MNEDAQKLADFLLANHIVSQPELDKALAAIAERGEEPGPKAVAQALVQQQNVTPNQIRRALAALKEQLAAGTRVPGNGNGNGGQPQIPGYETIARVGRGSQAVVYKARQLSMDRVVALKILDSQAAQTADFKARFIQEARSAAALSHNNIVQAYDAGETGEFSYFVQEFVDGTTVADVLKERGKPFGEEEALDIIIQIAEALAHAHSRGFIHRDVKPKNIMLTRQHVGKLADMGLARQVSDAEAAMAEAGKAFGTPYYIAPEQVRGDPKIDFRADIYSLGATLYQMVTGRVPFEAPKPQQVMQKHLTAPLVPPDHINTSLSAGISEVIEVMMQKRPQDRYASTEDLLLDLKAVRAGNPPALARQLVGGGSQALAGLEEGEQIESQQADSRSISRSALRPTGDEDEPGEGLPVSTIVIIVLASLLVLSLLFNLYQMVN